jgi:putative redox protein
MDVTLNWKNKMAFTAVANSGFQQTMDSDESVGGENSAGRPMEFIAMGLAGCTAMDVISILRKKKQAVSDFQIKLHAENAREHPKVFTDAVIEYIVTGENIDESAVLRAIELSVEKYCPAQAMLSRAFPMKLIYKILDQNGILVSTGAYMTKQNSLG